MHYPFMPHRAAEENTMCHCIVIGAGLCHQCSERKSLSQMEQRREVAPEVQAARDALEAVVRLFEEKDRRTAAEYWRARDALMGLGWSPT